MKAITFSLSTLLLLVAIVAVGCKALVSHTPVWGSVAVTFTMAMLAMAVVAAVFSAGGVRAFWVGFGIAGGAYMLLAFNFFFTNLGGYLVTTQLLGLGWNQVHDSSVNAPGGGARQNMPVMVGFDANAEVDAAWISLHYSEIMMQGFYSSQMPNSPRTFLYIGQSLWTLILAYAAGMLCSLLYVRRRRVDKQPAEAMS